MYQTQHELMTAVKPKKQNVTVSVRVQIRNISHFTFSANVQTQNNTAK